MRVDVFPKSVGWGYRIRMLHVYRAGQGEPLILLHGVGVYWRFWEPVLPMLEAHHDVLAPDAPGCGQSPPFPKGMPPDVRNVADALEATMDKAGLDTAHIAGHSFGGLLALELGRRGRARTVCAISPAGMVRGWEYYYVAAVLEAFRGAARALSHASMMPILAKSAAFRTLLLWPLASRPWRMEPEWLDGLARAYATAEDFTEILKATDWDFVTGRFAAIACPVVIGWGSRDRLLFPRQGPRYLQAIPSARLVRLRGIGHSPTSDDPPVVADFILRTTRLA